MFSGIRRVYSLLPGSPSVSSYRMLPELFCVQNRLSSMGSRTVTRTRHWAEKPPADTVTTAAPPSPSGAVTVAERPSPDTCTTSGSSDSQRISSSSVVSSGISEAVRLAFPPVSISSTVRSILIPSSRTGPPPSSAAVLAVCSTEFVCSGSAAATPCGREKTAEKAVSTVNAAAIHLLFFCPILFLSPPLS